MASGSRRCCSGRQRWRPTLPAWPSRGWPSRGPLPRARAPLPVGASQRSLRDSESLMRIALLTGGGDCPGLNAVIRAVVRRAQNHHFEVLGLRDGWKGLIE
ncbi:MAG: 6-phosphofructokinase, partial [Myxococcaceae bacterium]